MSACSIQRRSDQHHGRLIGIASPFAAPGQRIGLLGGTFNPPHAAHRLITLTALKRLDLDAVWWLVTPGNPLKMHNELDGQAHRMLLAEHVAHDRRIQVTGFEGQLGSSYTIETLRYLRARYPRVQFVWLMGADNLRQMHRWRQWRSIVQLMPFAVVNRPGSHLQALAAPAARAFARFRLPESRAASLSTMAAPAWTFLTGPLSDLSSTAIRAGRRGVTAKTS